MNCLLFLRCYTQTVSRLLCLAFLGLLYCSGCDGPIVKRALPAPPRKQVTATLTGQTYRVWGGDNFEFGHELELHYILLRGVDAPNPGQAWFRQSRAASLKLTRGKTVVVHVVDRDESMREIADVVVPVGKSKGDFANDPFNLGIELIRRGLARYNSADFGPDDTDLSQRYRAAETAAEQAQVGIWQTEP